MPFGPDYDDVYRDLIAEPLVSAGFTVRRADSLLNQTSVLQDVVKGIADADLVIADVTGLNPNVLYELGLAHAMGKRTVMITQSIAELPFDLRPYRANEYSTRFGRAGDLVRTLTDIGQAVLRGDAEFSNPVQDYAPLALHQGAQVGTTPGLSEPARTASRASGKAAAAPHPELRTHLQRLDSGALVTRDAAHRLATASKEMNVRTGDFIARAKGGQNSPKTAQLVHRAADQTAVWLEGYTRVVRTRTLVMEDGAQVVSSVATAVARMPSNIVGSDARNSLAALGATSRDLTLARNNLFSLSDTIIELRQLEHVPPVKGVADALGVLAEAVSSVVTALSEIERAERVLQDRVPV